MSLQLELISDGHAWMTMLQDRKRTLYTYNEATTNEILAHLSQRYAALFHELGERFAELADETEQQLGEP